MAVGDDLGKFEKKVDEEWKQRARAEKEAVPKAPPESQASGRRGEPAAQPPPPPTFNMLITGIATDALVSLGVIDNPLTGKKERNLTLARHFIDLLQMLEEKTKGNLDEGEQRYIESALHDLRMQFVSTVSQQGSAELQKDE
jgi:hypothetical protein